MTASLVTSAIRAEVRIRAGQRCEYCRKPDGYSAYGHQVDHIIAVKHDGSSDLDNLAWACFQCNNYKGSDIASYDGEILTPLFNPRVESWETHFELQGALIVGRTAIGRVTARLLQMNHPSQIETRQLLIKAGIWK